jgi:N-acetylglucosamine-6-phosphate deacetylase
MSVLHDATSVEEHPGTRNRFSKADFEPFLARVGRVTETWVRGRVVAPGGVVEDVLVAVADGVIVYAGPADAAEWPHPDPGRGGPEPEVVVSPGGGFVLPGLVDVHNHGGGGASFTSGHPAEVARAAGHHLRHGTTATVASVVTDRPEAMLAAVTTAADAVEQGLVAGVHVEGPFLSPRRCGAQDPRQVRPPDIGLARDLVAAGRGHVRVMTLAPEEPGAADVTELLLDLGVVPAVGHTEAEAGLVRRTLAATRDALGRPGLVTHLFNGMPPLHHRAPGPVAGALAAAAAGDAMVELVADGVHLHDETVRMVFDLLGPERIVLVTDAMAAAGMPDGHYSLGPQEVTVAGGIARVGDGPDAPLAGGTAHLLDVVRRCVGAGVPLESAVLAATGSPARALGLDGPGNGLTRGNAADLVVTDAQLRAVRVLRGGCWVGEHG